jgi:diguanylate cyclase (GGDEF)-like protein/PAS domain S-box-containing protein
VADREPSALGAGDSGASAANRAAPRAAARGRFAAVLDEVSQALSEASTDYGEVLRLVLRMVGTVLGGASALWLLDEAGGELAVAGVYDLDRHRQALLEKVLGSVRQRAATGRLGEVLASGRPLVVETASWRDVGAGAPPAYQAVLESLGPASLALAALRARGRSIGVLGVARPSEGGAFDALDVSLLTQLGDRAALAIDTARLLREREEEVAARREAEAALRASEAKLRSVARSGPVLLYACDASGVFTLLDGGLELPDAERWRAGDGRSFFEAFAGHPEVVAAARAALRGGTRERAALRLGDRHLDLWASAVRGPSGAVEGFAGVVADATARVAAEEAVLEGTRRQAALVEHASDVIAVITPDGTVHYINPAGLEFFGGAWRPGAVLDTFAYVHEEDRERVREHVRRAIRIPGVQAPIEFRMRGADGRDHYLDVIGNNLLDDPAVAGFVVTMRDVTDRREAEAALERHARRQSALAELGHWALAGLGHEALVDDALEALRLHLDASAVHLFEAVPGTGLLALRAALGHEEAAGAAAGATEGVVLVSAEPTESPAGYALATEEAVVSADLGADERFDLPAFWRDAGLRSGIEVPLPGPDGPAGVVGVGRADPRPFREEDVDFARAVTNVLAAASARDRAEAELRAQARRDHLSGLPNRIAFVEGADALLDAEPEGGTLFVLDVDRFREVNDTLGHEVGDRVLVEAARRLAELVPAELKLVARLGGDEFACFARCPDGTAAERLAWHLLAVVGEPLEVGGLRLRLRGSVGVASAPAGTPAERGGAATLLRRAEVAMYQAKAHRVGVRRFSEDLERSSVSRLALASELGEAIERGELRLEFQPKLSLASGAITGAEALVRWQHPARGLLQPDAFVPLAEHAGLIRPLTAWVLREALAAARAWHDAGWPIGVAVNLSAASVHDETLGELLRTELAASGLPAASVELEITESAVMLDPPRALALVTEMAALGLRFAVDDFGTGYSSLSYLQRLPVAAVKVDKSFVVPLASDPSARAIVRAVVELAHSLGVSVVAEGVESAAVLEAVRELGCDEAQGYLLAPPLAPPAFETWLATGAATGRLRAPGALSGAGGYQPPPELPPPELPLP